MLWYPVGGLCLGVTNVCAKRSRTQPACSSRMQDAMCLCLFQQVSCFNLQVSCFDQLVVTLVTIQPCCG